MPCHWRSCNGESSNWFRKKSFAPRQVSSSVPWHNYSYTSQPTVHTKSPLRSYFNQSSFRAARSNKSTACSYQGTHFSQLSWLVSSTREAQQGLLHAEITRLSKPSLQGRVGQLSSESSQLLCSSGWEKGGLGGMEDAHRSQSRACEDSSRYPWIIWPEFTLYLWGLLDFAVVLVWTSQPILPISQTLARSLFIMVQHLFVNARRFVSQYQRLPSRYEPT